MFFAFWSSGMGEDSALDEGVAVTAAGGFVRTPGGMCRRTGLVSLGGGDEESVAAALAAGFTTGDG